MYNQNNNSVLGSAGGANVKSRISDRKKLIVIDIQIESFVKALTMLCAALIADHYSRST